MTSTLPLTWFIARAAGLVAFALLTLSVWAGLTMSSRLLGPKRQKSLLEWHRTLVWTSLAAVGLHGAAVLADPVLHFGPLAVLVPFAAPWKPGAVAAGITAAWLGLALALSFPLRKRIGVRAWRKLHYASFAAFTLALGHALFSGTDVRGLRGPLLVLIAAGPVLWLSFYRLLTPRTLPRRVAPTQAAS